MDDRAMELLERVRRFSLPGPVNQWRQVRLRLVGETRLSARRGWAPFDAILVCDAEDLSFRWDARISAGGLLRLRSVEEFRQGRGQSSMRLFGALPFLRYAGAPVDKRAAVRALAELPWRPFAFLDGPFLTWTSPAEDRLRVAYDDGRVSASVEFSVDTAGRVLAFRAEDRPRPEGGSFSEAPWSGVFGEYRTFAGMRLPAAAEASWHLPEEVFTYRRSRIIAYQASGCQAAAGMVV